MSAHHKFDPRHLHKLLDPERLKLLDIPAILERLDLPEKPALVDVGAGTGLFAGAFLDLLPGAKCICLDIGQELIDWITENRIPEYDGRLTAMLCGESTLPLEDSSTDLLFMITLHHELEDPAAMLTECLRVLKPGGKILDADWRPGGRPGCRHPERLLPYEAIRSDLESAGFTGLQECETSDSLNCITAVKPGMDKRKDR